MSLPGFFKLNKNKKFNYIPRYYDADKDDLQQRIRRVEAEAGIKRDHEFSAGITRGSFRTFRSQRAKAERKSTLRLIIILIILFAIAFYLFYL